jgi:hypothetical protein
VLLRPVREGDEAAETQRRPQPGNSELRALTRRRGPRESALHSIMHEGKENPPRRRAPREEAEKGPRAATRKRGVCRVGFSASKEKRCEKLRAQVVRKMSAAAASYDAAPVRGSQEMRDARGAAADRAGPCAAGGGRRWSARGCKEKERAADEEGVCAP